MRYWEADVSDKLNEALADWLSERVALAIKYSWEEEFAGWVDLEGGRLLLTIGGPRKPTDKDPSGLSDCYMVKFDLLEKLKEYATPYDDMGGPIGEEQEEDMRERTVALRKLAADIAALTKET